MISEGIPEQFNEILRAYSFLEGDDQRTKLNQKKIKTISSLLLYLKPLEEKKILKVMTLIYILVMSEIMMGLSSSSWRLSVIAWAYPFKHGFSDTFYDGMKYVETIRF
ncbi:hypothetical protein DICVIV_06788 [Dictyocaulus viviparus]|uniref:Uncharacterized protein n=1 Tax=Dictyocaulus viviparus TaxID=29172 RepID=A0A0D8XTI1_DICVI|nr:hypothetical protein DICVIV_06788 [Dictyocaulus viviparus]